MSDEWKTIRVPKDVYDDAKMRKEEHGVTWGEYVNPHAWHSVFDEPKEAPEASELTTTVEVDSEEIADMVLEEIADELEFNVTIDGESDMNEEDVRNMIQTEIDALKRDLR